MTHKKTNVKKPRLTRIALDGNEANVGDRVGSNVYAYELITALEELTRGQDDVIWTVLLALPPRTDLPPERPGWRYRVVSPRPLQTQLGLPLHLFLHRRDYDVYFTPGHYAPRLCPVPYVSSVMDLGYVMYPEHFRRSDFVQLKRWTSYSVRRAKKIIAISEHTKRDIAQHYHRSPRDIVVATPALTPLSPALAKKEERQFFQKHNIKKPYLLFVGTFQPRKNLERVVEAFEQFKATSQGKRAQLVLAGKVGWLAEPLLRRIHQSTNRSALVMTGFVTESEKQSLLKHATGTVLMGLYEGFGIPPLESMRVGTIPVVANTASLPEVVGDAGFTVDPLNTTAIAGTFSQLFALTASERRALKKAGQKRAREFSWKKSAQKVLATLLEVAGSGRMTVR